MRIINFLFNTKRIPHHFCILLCIAAFLYSWSDLPPDQWIFFCKVGVFYLIINLVIYDFVWWIFKEVLVFINSKPPWRGLRLTQLFVEAFILLATVSLLFSQCVVTFATNAASGHPWAMLCVMFWSGAFAPAVVAGYRLDDMLRLTQRVIPHVIIMFGVSLVVWRYTINPQAAEYFFAGAALAVVSIFGYVQFRNSICVRTSRTGTLLS